MSKVIANDTVRIADQREPVTKGTVYDHDHPVVVANPWLFDDPDTTAQRQRPPTSTAELGHRSMSSRPFAGVEQATAAPGEKRDITTVCDVCGFTAKNAIGLRSHMRTHDDG